MGKQSVLPPLWEIPQKLRDRLGEQAGRQRAMFSEGHLLLVLHEPPRGPGAQRKGRYFWRSPEGIWNSSTLGSGPSSLKRHLDEFDQIVDEYEEREERAVSAEDHSHIIDSLGPIHRTVAHLHQTLQDARKKCPQDRDLIILRDRAYEIERAAELLYNGAKNSLDFAIARQTEEQARNSLRMAISAHRLNLLAAFFFPVATLSAIFGVNLDHGFEHAHSPWIFVGLVGLGLAC